MAMRKVTGIYIAVRGDYTQYKEDLKKVRAETKEAATDISNAFGHAVMPGKIERSMKNLASNLHTVSSTAATSEVDFNKLKIALSDIAQVTGVAEEQFYALQNRMLQTAAGNNIEASFKKIQSAIGATDEEMLSFREQMGNASSAVNAAFKELNVSPLAKIREEIKNVIASYKLLASSELTSSTEVAAAKNAEILKLKKLGAEYKNLREEVAEYRSAGTGTGTSTDSAYSALGISSAKGLQEEYAKLAAAYATIKANANSTKQDVVNAQLAMENKAKSLSQAYNELSKAATAAAIAQHEEAQAAKANTVSNAYSTLGVTSQQALIAEMRQAANAYSTLKSSGVASARDIAAAHEALKAVLQKNIALIKETFSATTGTAVEQAVESLREEYIITDEQLEALKAKEASTAEENKLESSFRKLASAAGLTDEEVLKLKKDIGALSTEKAEASVGGFSVKNLSTLSARFLSLSASVSLLSYGMVRLEKGLYEAGMQANTLDTTFSNITGSTSRANAQLSYLRKTAADTGQNFWVLADSYKGLLAASNYSNIGLQTTQKLFTGLMKASSSYALTTEQTKGAIEAFTQIISKGKVQAEELRRQLGNRLYGAFGMAAEAMGYTTQQLDTLMSQGKLFSDQFIAKIADVLNNNFTGKLPIAVQRVNKLSEAWMDFKAKVTNSDAIGKTIEDITSTLSDPNVQTGISTVNSVFVTAINQILSSVGSVITSSEHLSSGLNTYLTLLIKGASNTTAQAEALDVMSNSTKRATDALKSFNIEASSTATGNLIGSGSNYEEDLSTELSSLSTSTNTAQTAALAAANKYLKKVSSSGDSVIDKLNTIKEKIKAFSDAFPNLSDASSQMEFLTNRINSIKEAWSSLADKAGEEKALAPLVKQLKALKGQQDAASTLKQLQAVLAAAETHMGNTPNQIAKINSSIRDTIAVNKTLIDSYKNISGQDSSTISLQIQNINALRTARKKYNTELKQGADESLAKEELEQNELIAQNNMLKTQTRQAQEFKKAYANAFDDVTEKINESTASLRKYENNPLVDKSQLAELQKQVALQVEVSDQLSRLQDVASYQQLTGDLDGYNNTLAKEAELQTTIATTAEEEQLAQEKYIQSAARAADDWEAGWENGINNVRMQMGNAYDEMSSFSEDLVSTTVDDFSDMLADLSTDWDDTVSDMEDTINDMLNDVLKMIYKIELEELAAGIIDSVSNGTSTTSGTSGISVTDTDLSGISVMDTDLSGISVMDTDLSGLSIAANAKGGAYSGGSLSSLSGSVVSKTTPFTYSKQIHGFAKGGVVGEGKQNEVILPIYQGSNGVYGVKASTSGNASSSGNSTQTPINQTFNVSTGVSQTVRTEMMKYMSTFKNKTIEAIREQSKRGLPIS